MGVMVQNEVAPFLWTTVLHTVDMTYQLIIELGHKILFAQHNVRFSLKKLQHMINCHLEINENKVCQ